MDHVSFVGGKSKIGSREGYGPTDELRKSLVVLQKESNQNTDSQVKELEGIIRAVNRLYIETFRISLNLTLESAEYIKKPHPNRDGAK